MENDNNNITQLFSNDKSDSTSKLSVTNNIEDYRIIEAILFASSEPRDEEYLARFISQNSDVNFILKDMQQHYSAGGVNLICHSGNWFFRTASDLKNVMQATDIVSKPLPKALMETLSVVAYHQPITRAEIEHVRQVGISKGIIDILMNTGWIEVVGKKETPGRPVLYGTTEAFLREFNLNSLNDLPGVEELKAAGFLDLDKEYELAMALELEDGSSND